MTRRPLRRLLIWLGLADEPATPISRATYYMLEFCDVEPVADPHGIRQVETYANHPVHRRRTDRPELT